MLIIKSCHTGSVSQILRQEAGGIQTIQVIIILTAIILKDIIEAEDID